MRGNKPPAAITCTIAWKYFNSRLYMRGNGVGAAHATGERNFNSRLYMRGNGVLEEVEADQANFNSRLYMRGNWQEQGTLSLDFLFQFTPLHERQHNPQMTHGHQRKFQFTPLHERQRKSWTRFFVRNVYFNSRLYMRGNSKNAQFFQ